MPVPTSIADLSTTAGSNSPAGTEAPSTLDNYQRAHASFIAQLRAVIGGATDPNIPTNNQASPSDNTSGRVLLVGADARACLTNIDSDSGWVNCTAKSGYSLGTPKLRVRKVNGTVFLQGAIAKTTGAFAALTDIATIPAGYRPATDTTVVCMATSQTLSTAAIEAYIKSTGDVSTGLFAIISGSSSGNGWAMPIHASWPLV